MPNLATGHEHVNPGEQQPGEFIYRSASISDAPAMILLEDQAEAGRRREEIPTTLVRPESVRQFEDLLPKPTTWSRLVFMGDTLAGYILGCPADDPVIREDRSDCNHIVALMVRPDYWRRGIGGDLLEWTFAELRHRGVKRLNLWTETDNPESHPLYERKGFHSTGRDRIHPERPDEQVEYEIDL